MMELEGSFEPAGSPPPLPSPHLSCCLLHQQAGREAAPITSAVQGSFLDGVGHGGAKEGDDGARVVAAYHSAARHNHVGSGLAQRRRTPISNDRERNNPFARLVSEFLTSAHL